ncbi:hypothetical protein IMG5_185660 [Ichthyophthirius multifiliis]|uniref:C3H1-type domain-containing protein n=1 Tax=Ichthyophthirius multifiliis TaxID=5932 RepID=G0R3J4_ICHMU|nr:hypothetical protein IMG5_185660 [Ichthyophthirius multifiliis]EGR27983.1 hypothetical protein IMG5_185660 [Ichthyophthirius multifiliis]|eukprot:XP_004027328.1 hypothetical protein IMG5_185660 [Ichthyophthirius multifiliis]
MKETKESVWELPEEILERVKDFREQYEIETQRENIKSNQQNKEEEEEQEQEKKEKEKEKEEPEQKTEKFAYKEGDQEYNIWYGRHLSDTKSLVRDHKQPAVTRCDSELDTGYTKADISDKYSAYFCHHWAKGCCSEGVKCRYFHRVPSFSECLTIDNSRDVFGRARHSQHREDRGGVGSFLQDTRSLEVNDFKCPPEGVSGIMYGGVCKRVNAASGIGFGRSNKYQMVS